MTFFVLYKFLSGFYSEKSVTLCIYDIMYHESIIKTFVCRKILPLSQLSATKNREIFPHVLKSPYFCTRNHKSDGIKK